MKKQGTIFDFKDTIGYLLFKKIFLGYITFVILFTSFQVYKEYDDANSLVSKSFINIENSYSKILSNTVWNFNEEKIDNQIKAIVNSNIVTGVIVLSTEDEVIDRLGTLSLDMQKYEEFVFEDTFKNSVTFHKKLVSYQFELVDNSNNEEELIGTVILFVENSEVLELAKEGIVLILANVIFSALILWLLFIYFANKLLAVPLNELINATKDLDVENPHDLEISLNTEKKNELNTLADTFNLMSKRIYESYVNLKQLTLIQGKQKKDLEDANRFKADFLANMSHELKTPLNSINVISSIMMKNKDMTLNEKQVKNLKIINNCGNDLLFLINDVLDISKLEAGKVELEYRQISAKTLMCDIYDMFEAQTKEKEVSFSFNCDDNIGDIYTDEVRVKQVIKNLLSNALKFVDRGRIDFLVKDNEEYLKIQVIDNGIGIEQDKLEHIFDRFKQADGSTTRKYGGTGLGLAICKELLDLLEGEISVESQVSVGTTFTVLLPKNKEKLVIKEEHKNTKEDKVSLEKKSLILLNTNPLEFMSIVVELNKEFEVEQVNTLNDLLKKYKEKNFDFIVIDIKNQNIENIEKFSTVINKRLVLIGKDDSYINNDNLEFLDTPIDIELLIKKIKG